MTQSQTAADAAATINGLAVTSTSNTLSNIVDGLTLNLSHADDRAGEVNVVTDTEALKKTVTDFAAAYTALVKLIATDTKYDADRPRRAAPCRATAPRSACSASCARSPASASARLGAVRPPLRRRPASCRPTAR